MAEQRIQKVLSDQGVCSRRAAEKLIDEGRVKVNGHPVTLGDKMDPDFDKVSIDGKSVRIVRKRQYTYLMLNKPRGYITTASDERGRKTVMDLLTGVDRRVYPIGRLDKDSEGLLLLTNEGGLAHELLSPKKHVDKIYYAKVSGKVTEEDVVKLAEGVDIGEKDLTRPARLEILSTWESGTESAEAGKNWESEIRLTIHEGKFHQVKRMMEALGKKVTYLKRLSMGPMALPSDLPTGKYRSLTEKELELLKSAGNR